MSHEGIGGSGLRFDLVTMDAADSTALAGFWSEACQLEEVEREDDGRWIVLADSSGARRIGIQRLPTPTFHPGRLHFDLAIEPDRLDAEVARLVALGATLLGPVREEPYGAIANLADPEGNRFDVCGYGLLR